MGLQRPDRRRGAALPRARPALVRADRIGMAVPRRRPAVAGSRARSTSRSSWRTSTRRRSRRSATTCSLAFYPASYVALVLMVRARVRRFQASMWLDGLIGALTIGAAATAVFLAADPREHRPRHGRDRHQPGLPGRRHAAARAGGRLLRRHRLAARPRLAAGRAPASRRWRSPTSLFLYLSANDTYVEGTLLDALWPASSLLLSYAAWVPAERKPAGDMLRGVVMLFAPGPVRGGGRGADGARQRRRARTRPRSCSRRRRSAS